MAPKTANLVPAGSLIGYRRDGRPIYLIGGAEDAPAASAGTPAAAAPAAAAPIPTESATAAAPASGDDPDLGDKGKKAIEREREARKAAEKALGESAAKLKEYEDRDKSEAQKLADENAALKEENAKTAREALVAKVAMAHKLDTEDLDLLHGDTEEELTARAKRIQDMKTAATAATGPGSADQGAQPPASNDLKSQIKAAEVKGDFATAMRLKNQQAMAMITAT